MKALTFRNIGEIQLKDVPKPTIVSENDAIIKVTTAAICGSDLHFVHGLAPMAPGTVLGHEFCGVVEDVGSAVTKFKPGDRVVSPAGASCGKCDNCRAGKMWACEHGGVYGNGPMFGDLQGAQAEYARVLYADEGLRHIPDGVTDEQILFVGDILATAFTGITGVKPNDTGLIMPGESVAIYGDGPVGLSTTAVAKLYGASEIIVVGHHDYRLEVAKKLGATRTINAYNETPVDIIMEMTSGKGVNLAVECAGKAESFYNCLNSVCLAGIVNVLGIVDTPVTIDYSRFISKNVTIEGGICNNIHIDKLISLVKNKTIDMAPIITHRFPLTEAENAYHIFENRLDGVIKVILKP